MNDVAHQDLRTRRRPVWSYFPCPILLALPELFELHSVLERNPKSPGGKVEERFGVDVKIHKSFEDVVMDKTIELIIVGTPNATHYEFVRGALEAGKHGSIFKYLASCTLNFIETSSGRQAGRSVLL